MGSIDKRLERLEAHFGQEEPEDPAQEFRRRMRYEILDEYGKLKGSRAVGYRGGGAGNPLVCIEPEDIPGKVLGPGYTQGEMMGLAVRRVVERELIEDLEPEEAEALIEGWTAGMRSIWEQIGRGDKWDELEDAS